MTAVRRLVTIADIDDEVPAANQVSVAVRHEAELADGTRVLLLNDRGWGSSGQWAAASADDIRETARMVVGPDEPFDGRSHRDMEADHWAGLRDILQRQGVEPDATELSRLPHDVLLSSRLLARISASGPS